MFRRWKQECKVFRSMAERYMAKADGRAATIRRLVFDLDHAEFDLDMADGLNRVWEADFMKLRAELAEIKRLRNQRIEELEAEVAYREARSERVAERFATALGKKQSVKDELDLVKGTERILQRTNHALRREYQRLQRQFNAAEHLAREPRKARDEVAAELALVTRQRNQAWRGLAKVEKAANCVGHGWIGKFREVVDVPPSEPTHDATTAIDLVEGIECGAPDPCPPAEPMSYKEFAATVSAAGMDAYDYSNVTIGPWRFWKISGNLVVLVWPDTEQGFLMAIDFGPLRPGNVGEAIELAKGEE